MLLWYKPLVNLKIVRPQRFSLLLKNKVYDSPFCPKNWQIIVAINKTMHLFIYIKILNYLAYRHLVAARKKSSILDVSSSLILVLQGVSSSSSTSSFSTSSFVFVCDFSTHGQYFHLPQLYQS